MTGDDSEFLVRLREMLEETEARRVAEDQRHPARKSKDYLAQRREAAAEVEALCDRLISELKLGIAEIDRTVGPIAAPLGDQLAKGAISDVFEAAAEVLKSQIRRADGSSS